MFKWQIALCCVIVFLCPSENAGFGNKHTLLPGKGVLNAIPEILGHPATETSTGTQPGLSTETEQTSMADLNLELSELLNDNAPEPPDRHDQPPDNQNHWPGQSNYPPDGANYQPDESSYVPDSPVQYAALPRGLAVVPLPLDDSDHELKLNVSWQAGLGPPAKDYSLEVRSVTDTVDCQSPMCYEYNIPGELAMWTIPVYSNPVAETCAVRPGCSYRVRLIAHPWDGHTAANLFVELDECVAGVCSCGHAPRLPAPQVSARLVTVQQEVFANITWSLPRPMSPHRLPPGLYKKNYVVSIGKQMVSNAHPAPWFANTISRHVDADGPVGGGDGTRWLLLPIDERVERRKRKKTPLDVRLLARVSLIDDRGCLGPAGNATVFDPAENAEVAVGTYVLWAVFGGACVLTMGAVVAVSARVVKRILNAFRPPGSTAPLDQLRRRPAWFPLQIRTNMMWVTETAKTKQHSALAIDEND